MKVKIEGALESTLAGLPRVRTRADAVTGIAREEFEEIVRRHQRRVFRILRSLVSDTDTAETLTQECFLRAYRSRLEFRGEASVGTWLVRIAINLAADHGRNRRTAFWRRLFPRHRDEANALAAAHVVPDPGASPLRQLMAREQLQAVWVAVDELSANQRTAFVLRFVEEMSIEEISQSMDIETGTVKSHLARALAAVRKKTKENGRHA
jgi:RNA polymerase sigma-70 factor (ECF subfamily)